MWKYFELLLWNHFVIKGADELDLSSFKYGGMNVTGFSIMDPTYEENIQQSDCYSYEGLCPINVSISNSKIQQYLIVQSLLLLNNLCITSLLIVTQLCFQLKLDSYHVVF